MELNAMEQAIRKAGYVRGPEHNSRRWYAGSPGLPEPLRHFKSVIDGSDCTMRADTMVYEDRIVVTGGVFHPDEIIATFSSVEDYLAYCREYGALSEPGLPAFSNSWD